MFKWTLPMEATVWIPIFLRCGTPYDESNLFTPPTHPQSTKTKKKKEHKMPQAPSSTTI